jgi:hypothetical protein
MSGEVVRRVPGGGGLRSIISETGLTHLCSI